MVKFRPWLPYPRRRKLGCPLNRRLGRPQSRPESFGEQKYPLPLLEIETGSVQVNTVFEVKES